MILMRGKSTYFNISMDDIEGVAVLDGVYNGSNSVSCLLLTVGFLLQDGVE